MIKNYFFKRRTCYIKTLVLFSTFLFYLLPKLLFDCSVTLFCSITYGYLQCCRFGFGESKNNWPPGSGSVPKLCYSARRAAKTKLIANSANSVQKLVVAVFASLLMVDFSWAGIFKQSMGVRNRVGIGLSYRPASLYRLAEFIPWNRLLGSINV